MHGHAPRDAVFVVFVALVVFFSLMYFRVRFQSPILLFGLCRVTLFVALG